MNIIVVGLNHDTAGIEIREKVAFDGPRLEEAVDILKNSPGVKENIIISTCNRVEIYAGVRDSTAGAGFLKNFISDFHNMPADVLDKSLYAYSGRKALRHIFRVASSLDSMVVGEPQILGQLKDAFDFALKKKSTGVLLNKMMKKAISAAKRTRTETKIGESAVSISFAAVELARKIFEDLSPRSFMLIGAGEMAELAARHLVNNGVRDVFVTNRTYKRAEELAREFNGRVIEFEGFVQGLIHTDIVICSTGAPSYILKKEDIHKIMKLKKNSPMFIIDISVPRNVDPAINEIYNVYLYDIDDLLGVIAGNIQERGREAEKAERIIDEEVEAFMNWHASLAAVPTIVALRNKAEAIGKEELDKTIRKLGGLGEKETRTIEALVNSIVNKIIHFPSAALKSGTEETEMIADIVNRIFDLNTGQDDREG